MEPRKPYFDVKITDQWGSLCSSAVWVSAEALEIMVTDFPKPTTPGGLPVKIEIQYRGER